MAEYGGPTQNGRPMLNGMGQEESVGGSVDRVGVSWQHPMDEIEPLPKTHREQLYEILCRVIYAFESVPGYRLKARCVMKIIRQEGRSLEEIGRDFGITRQAVDKVYKPIEVILGVKGRGDKSDEACEKYRKINTGKRRVKCQKDDLTKATNGLQANQRQRLKSLLNALN